MSRDAVYSGAVENPNAGFEEALAPAIDPSNPYGIRDGVATRWVTKDKRSLLMAEMDGAHLQNTLRFLLRKIEDARNREAEAFGFAGTCRGEMASYYAGHAASDASDDAHALSRALEPILRGLRAELQRRGLPELVP